MWTPDPDRRCQEERPGCVCLGVKAVRIIGISIGVLLLCSGPAAADTKVVPPGHSAGNQYVEALPGGGGETPVTSVRGDGGGTSLNASGKTEALGAGSAERLEAAGPDGRAVARLAAATSVGAGGVGAGKPLDSSASGRSALSQVSGQLTGTSSPNGIGPLLPLAIAAISLGALAFALKRRTTPSATD
jgi:hypothetical protein